MIFKDVARVFQGSFKKTFKVFKKVSGFMALIAASRAEGGLVEVGVGLWQYLFTYSIWKNLCKTYNVILE